MFLHANVQHILFNMTSLLAVGTLAERFYGSVRFLAIYLGAGLIGAMTSVVYFTLIGQPDAVGVGASGAIFGVAGALVTLRFQRSEVIPQRVRERVTSSMIPLVLISLPLSYILAPNVDNSAHIGGLLGGILLSFIFPVTSTVPSKSALR
jgi:rhomboid protease GluP